MSIAEGRFVVATVHERNGEYDEAQGALLSVMVTQDPEWAPRAAAWLGELRLKANDLDGAVLVLQQAVDYRHIVWSTLAYQIFATIRYPEMATVPDYLGSADIVAAVERAALAERDGLRSVAYEQYLHAHDHADELMRSGRDHMRAAVSYWHALTTRRCSALVPTRGGQEFAAEAIWAARDASSYADDPPTVEELALCSLQHGLLQGSRKAIIVAVTRLSELGELALGPEGRAYLAIFRFMLDCA